jgi:uncharacterized protein
MGIIGRTEEKLEFARIVSSDKSEFVTVYGRRRIGKTFLIRQYFEDQFAFHITGLQKKSKKLQLKNFYTLLAKKYILKKKEVPANDWMGAFEHLKAYLEKPSKGKKIVFFDELPWLATAQSDFLVALENFWNHWASGRKDIVLIVCGSAASWMMKHILREKGGLHNRVTRRMKILPFTLQECELFLKKKKFILSRYEIVKLYMCLGGIPFYLELLDADFPISKNIDRLCFAEGGALRNEFNELYTSLFKSPINHIKIVKALGQKPKGLSRLGILKASGLANGGSATNVLEELEQSGFITKYQNFGKLKRDAIYQLTDYFTLFHFKFIEKSSVLDTDYWVKKLDQPKQRAWSGLTFEMVCMHHINNIKKAMQIAGIDTTTSMWQNKDAQIDLLIDRRDNVVSICEAKYSIEPFMIDKDYFEKIQNKIVTVRQEINKSKSIQVVMITTFGLVNSKYNTSIVQQIITLDELFV